MEFTKQELKEINRKLEMAEQRQLKNGDKKYSIEEAWNIIKSNIGQTQHL